MSILDYLALQVLRTPCDGGKLYADKKQYGVKCMTFIDNQGFKYVCMSSSVWLLWHQCVTYIYESDKYVTIIVQPI